MVMDITTSRSVEKAPVVMSDGILNSAKQTFVVGAPLDQRDLPTRLPTNERTSHPPTNEDPLILRPTDPPCNGGFNGVIG
jgi:hypothetical protein